MKKLTNTKKVIMIGVFSAIAFVLQLIAPFPKVGGFLEIEISDLPALILAFAYGPVAGVVCELMKNILHGLMFTTTGYVGEFANFVINGVFVATAGVIYKYNKSFKGAIVSLVVATLLMSVSGIFVNLYVMLPLYMPKAPKSVTMPIVLGTILPFNIVKGIVISVITMFIYKRISPIIKFSGGQK